MLKRHRDIILFFLIAFLFPLIMILLQSIIQNNTINYFLFALQAASPTIAAIVVVCVNKRFKKFFKENLHSRRLITAIVLPFLIAGSTMLLAKLIFCGIYKIKFSLNNISLSQFIIILWALVAEEIGWRGYLYPYFISKGIKKCLVPLIIGTIWCFWHYHFFLQSGIQVPLEIFLVSCIVESYIYSYLLNCTKNNLVSSMTYHFGWNFFVNLFAINPIANNGSPMPYVFLIILEVLVVGLFFLISKRNCKNNLYTIESDLT